MNGLGTNQLKALSHLAAPADIQINTIDGGMVGQRIECVAVDRSGQTA